MNEKELCALIAKVQNCEFLTDDELASALEFYNNLQKSLEIISAAHKSKKTKPGEAHKTVYHTVLHVAEYLRHTQRLKQPEEQGLVETTIGNHTGNLFTVEEFRESVKDGLLIDYDGYGDAVKDGQIITLCKDDPFLKIKPSKLDEIPIDVTHILWYNK